MTPPTELNEWLCAATSGLPRQLRPRIQRELSAHYEDAFADAVSSGCTVTDAHHQALAQLGSPRTVAKGLRTIHLERRRCLLALCVGIISLLWLIIGSLMVGSALLFSLPAFVMSLFILRTFRQIVEKDHENALRLPLTWVEICTLLVILPGVLGSHNTAHYPMSLMLTDPIVLESALPNAGSILPLHILLASALIGVGVGWWLVRERIAALGVSLYRLAPLLQPAIWVSGLALFASAIAMLARHSDAASLAILVSVAAGFARHVLLILLFFRVAYPDHTHPHRETLS